MLNSEIECLYCIDSKEYLNIEIQIATVFLHIIKSYDFPTPSSFPFRHYVAICKFCYDKYIRGHVFNKHNHVSREEYLASTIVDGYDVKKGTLMAVFKLEGFSSRNGYY